MEALRKQVSLGGPARRIPLGAFRSAGSLGAFRPARSARRVPPDVFRPTFSARHFPPTFSARGISLGGFALSAPPVPTHRANSSCREALHSKPLQ